MLVRFKGFIRLTRPSFTINGSRLIGTSVPFGDDLGGGSKNEILEHDPNLAGFFEEKDFTVQETEIPDVEDEYDFSDIKSLNKDTFSHREYAVSPAEIQSTPSFSGQTFSTEEATNILTMLERERGAPVDEEFLALSENFITEKLDLSSFKRFIDSYQLANLVVESESTEPKKQVYESGFFESKKPTVFISQSQDPFLNLALEMFIYDKMPQTSKRLVLYINSPCIVLGKNQNPFKEINLRVSGALGIPILRRFSGGGTVVHDFGNVNFSYMASKSSFDRVGYTSTLVETMNNLVATSDVELNGRKFEMPKFTLKTTAKGDIVGEFDEKKVSGSAFKLSKGKFLHHGTMLLDSNLDTLRTLLKVSELQKTRVISKGTESIPSSVANLHCSREMFMWICAQSFSTHCGNGPEFNWNNIDLVLIDDCATLPQEILKYRDTLKDWNHTFGSGPRWSHELILDSGDKIIFKIDNKGQIASMVTEAYTKPLSSLMHAIESGEKIRYTGSKVKEYVTDAQLANWLAWNIDYELDYRRLGCVSQP